MIGTAGTFSRSPAADVTTSSSTASCSTCTTRRTGKGREHQMVNFLREGSENGTLYLAGARGGIDIATALIGDDILDLYRVDEIDGAFRLKWITSKTKSSHPNADPTAAPSILTTVGVTCAE